MGRERLRALAYLQPKASPTSTSWWRPTRTPTTSAGSSMCSMLSRSKSGDQRSPTPRHLRAFPGRDQEGQGRLQRSEERGHAQAGSLSFAVLSADTSFASQDLNQTSLVLRLVFGKVSFLFMGTPASRSNKSCSPRTPASLRTSSKWASRLKHASSPCSWRLSIPRWPSTVAERGTATAPGPGYHRQPARHWGYRLRHGCERHGGGHLRRQHLPGHLREGQPRDSPGRHGEHYRDDGCRSELDFHHGGSLRSLTLAVTDLASPAARARSPPHHKHRSGSPVHHHRLLQERSEQSLRSCSADRRRLRERHLDWNVGRNTTPGTWKIKVTATAGG